MDQKYKSMAVMALMAGAAGCLPEGLDEFLAPIRADAERICSPEEQRFNLFDNPDDQRMSWIVARKDAALGLVGCDQDLVKYTCSVTPEGTYLNVNPNIWSGCLSRNPFNQYRDNQYLPVLDYIRHGQGSWAYQEWYQGWQAQSLRQR